MSAYDFDEMIKLWGQDKLTTEQAVGQILQHLQGVVERLGRLETLAEARRVAETAVSPPKRKTRKKKS